MMIVQPEHPASASSDASTATHFIAASPVETTI
jgi:hypothetical protein